MFLSIAIFLCLPFMLSTIAYSISREKLTKTAFKYEIIFISLIFSFFMGLRYEVGIDYFAYYNTYTDFSLTNVTLNNFEPFFYWLYRFGHGMGFTSHFIFIVSSFVQSYFYLLAFKHHKNLLPYAILFLFFLMIFTYLNIIRQCAAYSVILVAYSNISRKKYWTGFCYIILASLFHRSSFVCFIVYGLLFKKCFFDKWEIQCFIILIIMLFGNIAVDDIFDFLNSFISSFSNKRFSSVESEVNSGVGVLLKYVQYICILFLFRKKNTFYYIFNKRLFLIGCVIYGCFTYSMIMSRIALFFQMSQLFLLPELAYDFKKFWNIRNSLDKCFFLLLIFIILLLYIAPFFGYSSQQCIPFKFNFGNI